MAERPATTAAAGLIEELQAEGLVEADEAAEDVSAEQQTETEDDDDGFEIPEVSTDVPADLADLFDGPDDIDLDDEGEPEAAYEELDVDEYDDPEKAKLAKQLNKLNKQLAWEKAQKAKVAQKVWTEEARKYFQFSNPEVIRADSRRAFLRQAKAQHDAVAKVAKPVFDQLKVQREKIREEVRAEERASAEKRWGRPPQGPGGATGRTDTDTMNRGRLGQGRSLKDALVEKLKAGEVNL